MVKNRLQTEFHIRYEWQVKQTFDSIKLNSVFRDSFVVKYFRGHTTKSRAQDIYWLCQSGSGNFSEFYGGHALLPIVPYSLNSCLHLPSTSGKLASTEY